MPQNIFLLTAFSNDKIVKFYVCIKITWSDCFTVHLGMGKAGRFPGYFEELGCKLEYLLDFLVRKKLPLRTRNSNSYLCFICINVLHSFILFIDK